MAIALAARHPARVRTLVLMEPAWADDKGMSQAEAAARERIATALALEDPDEMMRGFTEAQLAPSVVPPPRPAGPPPAWLAKRPAGVRAFWPRMVIERFPERHHFDPPHRTEPTRVAAALERLWTTGHRG